MKTKVYVCDSMIMTPVVLDFTCNEGFPHYIAVVIIWETKSQCLQFYGYTSKFAFYFFLVILHVLALGCMEQL